MIIALSVLLSFVFLAAGTRKVRGADEVVAEAAHLGLPWSVYRPIGLVEYAAVVGLLAGLWWRPVGIAAAAGLVALMIGAVAARLRARDGVALCLLPAFVGLICAVLVALHLRAG